MYRFSVQFIQVHPHHREHELCLRASGIQTPDVTRERTFLCHTDLYTIAVISYGHHWWDSSHYTLIYIQVTALQRERLRSQ